MTGSTSGIARSSRVRTPLWQTTLIAFIAAAIANIVLFFIANALLPQPVSIPAEMGAINIVSITISSLVGTLGALVAFVLIKRFTRHPARIFLIVSILALIVSMAGPFGSPGIALSTRLVLALMHVVAAAIIVPLLMAHAQD